MLGFAFHILELPTLYHQVEQQGQNWLQNTFDWISDNFLQTFFFIIVQFSSQLSSTILFYHSLVYRNAESEFYGSEKNFQQLSRVKNLLLFFQTDQSFWNQMVTYHFNCLKPALTVSLSSSNLTNFGSTLYFFKKSCAVFVKELIPKSEFLKVHFNSFKDG